MYEYNVTVRFNDCDSMGHVNNTAYFTYFEEARKDIFKLFNPALDIDAWNLIVASTQCDFVNEMNYAQKVSVYTWISRVGTSSFTVEHAIQDDEGRWTARGKAVLAGYDFAERKTVPISEPAASELALHQEGPENVPELRG
ncbi:acyl-CoA thioesterase [Alkalicoccus halolimnae]|uniref:Thioesterase family protein n=1 Tax=Alkalicoccus halolimnae TaxID=1667239 RepID=A0A5C7FDI4_9BACI|nr:thioesterase family protein [Alkalicoccus halolimnae]TXF83277.1 acyl-CoA thioesterase [Alkalicoccus halolimnae]